MNGKRVNLAFLISILLYLLCGLGIGRFFPKAAGNLSMVNLICEAAILVPGILFALFSKEKLCDFMGFKSMKVGTVLAIIPFTMFTSPFITLLNLITQFFTENAAAGMMTDYHMSELSFLQMFFTIAIFAPFCEEVACRGVYYQGYKKNGSAFWAMLLSSLLFGLVHMNMNQAVYAFGMGILAVLLVEATGSLWSSVIYHGLINGSQVVMMYFMLRMDSQIYEKAAAETVTTSLLMYSVAVYLVIAAVCLPLGWALLVWMSGREGRSNVLGKIWEDRTKKGKLLSVPLILAIIICGIMVAFSA